MSEDNNSSSENESEKHNSRAIMASSKVCKEFIATYRKHRFLWDPAHTYYNSKYRRSKAYDELVTILKRSTKNANHQLVRKQINGLRSNYRKLHRKYLQSRIVKNGKEVYTFVPDNWRYYEMQFLDSVGKEPSEHFDPQTEDDTASNVNTNNAPEDTSIRERTFNSKYQHLKMTLKKEMEQPTEYDDDNDTNVAIKIVDEASKEDFKVIGDNVAFKLKRMGEDQRNYAELLINKILINALNGKLNDATDIVGFQLGSDCDNSEVNDNEYMTLDDDNTDFDKEFDDTMNILY